MWGALSGFDEEELKEILLQKGNVGPPSRPPSPEPVLPPPPVHQSQIYNVPPPPGGLVRQSGVAEWGNRDDPFNLGLVHTPDISGVYDPWNELLVRQSARRGDMSGQIPSVLMGRTGEGAPGRFG